jgi:hypothetical protein
VPFFIAHRLLSNIKAPAGKPYLTGAFCFTNEFFTL